MLATIIIGTLLGAWIVYCVVKMVRKLKHGKGFCNCGCDGNCSKCTGCDSMKKRKKDEDCQTGFLE